jgi:hypothetical protein
MIVLASLASLAVIILIASAAVLMAELREERRDR